MVNVAILGYGTVGSGVYEVINKNGGALSEKLGRKIQVVRALDLRSFDNHPTPEIFTKNFDDILNDTSISVVCETMGGITPAFDFTKKSLMAKKHVISSNKELVATHGALLLDIAAKNNVSYLFEASVGGGIPIVRPLTQCLIANQITQICGILNGTTNFILTKMVKEKSSFCQALKEAQDLGYAEANPDADVLGHDTCRKIAILTSLIHGRQIDYRLIQTVGITGITSTDVAFANSHSCVIKLVGFAKVSDGLVTSFVGPVFIPIDHPLANCEDVFNSILVKGDSIGECLFYGRGAGKLPTASAVVADVVDACKNHSQPPLSQVKPFWREGDPSLVRDINSNQTKFFVRTKNKQRASELFPNASITRIHDEYGFITEIMTEGEFYAKISGENFSVMRVIGHD